MIILPSTAFFGCLCQIKKRVNIQNMHQDIAQLTEIDLNGKTTGRIRCAPQLIPAPGQYLLAQADQDPDAPLATPLFRAGLCPGGFTLANPLPLNWQPGLQLNIRGPLGKGFQIPPTARFIALASFSTNPARLLALTESVLKQRAAVVLLADNPPDGLPAAIEISPIASLTETIRWTDYLAMDTPRALLPGILQTIQQTTYQGDGQIFVETPIPCGGMGECGVCAITLRKSFKLTCKDGPVFDLKNLLE
jgi:hypothetical protein